MKARLYHRWAVTITLDREEEFGARNSSGLPFFVRHVRYSGGTQASISGDAQRVDGTRGYINRWARVPVVDLPEPVFRAIKSEMDGFTCNVEMGVVET